MIKRRQEHKDKTFNNIEKAPKTFLREMKEGRENQRNKKYKVVVNREMVEKMMMMMMMKMMIRRLCFRLCDDILGDGCNMKITSSDRTVSLYRVIQEPVHGCIMHIEIKMQQ